MSDQGASTASTPRGLLIVGLVFIAGGAIYALSSGNDDPMTPEGPSPVKDTATTPERSTTPGSGDDNISARLVDPASPRPTTLTAGTAPTEADDSGEAPSPATGRVAAPHAEGPDDAPRQPAPDIHNPPEFVSPDQARAWWSERKTEQLERQSDALRTQTQMSNSTDRGTERWKEKDRAVQAELEAVASDLAQVDERLGEL